MKQRLTPQETSDTVRSASVLRTARKLRGLTQIEASRRLGISQALISKLENGLLSPSASLWFAATRLYDIESSTTFETGYIDTFLNEQVVLSESTFRVPKKYLKNPSFTCRSIIPLLTYIEAEKGKDVLNNFLEERGLDPDLFNILDAQINMKFLLEVIELLDFHRLLKKNKIAAHVKQFNLSGILGHLRPLYESSTTVRELLTHYVDRSSAYEANTVFTLKVQNANLVNLSMAPPAVTIQELKGAEKTKKFICHYKKELIKKISSYRNLQEIDILHESECAYEDESRCHFEIKLFA